MSRIILYFLFLTLFVIMSCTYAPRYRSNPTYPLFSPSNLRAQPFAFSSTDTSNSFRDVFISKKWIIDGTSINFDEEPNPIPPFIVSISKWLGTKYRYGGSSKKGLDCSGFVNAVFSENGVKLPRSSKEIAKKGDDVHPDSIRFGDVICFKNRNGRIFHVGIMLNQDRFAHASRKGVTVGSTNDPYWKNKLATIRRFEVKGLPSATINEILEYETIDEPLEGD